MLKCTICGEAITRGDDVCGIVRGIAESNEAIDVHNTIYVHFSCYRDAKIDVYPEI